MANSHPQNAAYVSADGKVSFDRYGRKLDSNGNVVAGDRQRAGDAGAKPLERRQEQQQPQQQAQPAARYTFPAGATGQPVQRSAWDNSPVQSATGAATAAGVSGAGRGNNPNVLAPGGVDPATGKPYPTAMNGGLAVPAQGSGKAWRQPWMNQPAAPSVAPSRPSGGNIPFVTDGLNVASPSMQTGGLNVMPPQGNGFMYDPTSGGGGGNPLPMMTPNVDRTGPQNFGRNLDVSAYLPGGAMYGKSWR